MFPNAVGEVRLVVQYSKVPESADTRRRYARCVLAQLASALRRCPLVLGDSLQVGQTLIIPVLTFNMTI